MSSFEIFLIIISTQILTNLFLINIWKIKKLSRLTKIYSSEQKIHSGFIPRYGGIAIIFTIFVLSQITENFHIKTIINFVLLCSTPVFLIIFIEDTFNNVKPIYRLIFLLITSIILLNFTTYDFPKIDLPFLNQLFNNYSILLTITLILSIAALCNGFNLIDGVNGLFLSTLTSILISMVIIAKSVGDANFTSLFTYLLFIYCFQFPFNYPKSFIFLGDLGAYFSGIIIGYLVIIFFGAHDDILSWNVVLVLFYPIFELIFSIIRRFIVKSAIFGADTKHLHHLINSYFYKKTGFLNLSNSLTMIVLTPIWIFPFLWFLFLGVVNSIQIIAYGILIQIIIYLFMYYIFHNKN